MIEEGRIGGIVDGGEIVDVVCEFVRVGGGGVK